MGRFADRTNKFLSLYAMFRLARRPDQVKYVFMIGDAQDNLAERSRAGGAIRDPYVDDALEAMWRDRYHPPLYDVNAMAAMPAETMGGTYARFMVAHGLRPDFYENIAARHKMHYLRLRLRQTHDIWHVLTGFGTDQFGEVGLQGFYFAQVTNGQSVLIFAGSIFKSVFAGRFDEVEQLVTFFCEGYQAGRQAERLLAVQWEKHWSDSVQNLRNRLRIEVPRCARESGTDLAPVALQRIAA